MSCIYCSDNSTRQAGRLVNRGWKIPGSKKSDFAHRGPGSGVPGQAELRKVGLNARDETKAGVQRRPHPK